MSLYEIEEHIGALITEEELPTEAMLNENRPLHTVPKSAEPRTMQTEKKEPAHGKRFLQRILKLISGR